MFFTKLKERFYQILTFSVLAVSGAICLSWIFNKTPSIFRIQDDWPLLGFNVAFCFLLLALVNLLPKQKKLASGLMAFVLVASGISYLQYLFDFQVGIENFLWQTFTNALYNPKASMALSTAVCFFLISLTGLVHRPRFIFDIVAVLNNTLVLGFAVINLLAFQYGFNAEYGWGSYSRMAFLSTVGFIFLSSAFLVRLSQDVRERYRTRVAFVPFQILMASVFCILIIWQLLVQRDQEANRRITYLQTLTLKNNIDRGFDPLVKVLGHMSRRNSAGAYRLEPAWQSDAESYFNEFPFVRRILQTDNKSVIQWAYPLTDGGAEVLHRRVGWWNSDLRKYMEQIEGGQRFAVSQVFEVRSGQKVFVFFAPSFQNKKYLGAIGAVIYSDLFFQQYLELSNYDVSVREEGRLIYQKGTPEPAFANYWRSEINYRMLGVRWDIEVIPKPQLIRANTSTLPLVVLIMGLVFSILLTLSLQFYFRSRNSEKMMKEVLDWKQASLNSTPLMFISLDENVIIREMNAAAEELLEYKSEEIVGKVSPLIFHDLGEVREYQRKLEMEVGRTLSLGRDYMEAIFERGYHKSSEWVMRAKGGRRYHLNISTSRIINEAGQTTGFLQILEDVTAIRERERILEEQERKLATSSRLASLGEMAAGIAHEINNPLAIINGHVSVLKKQLQTKGLDAEPEIKKRLDTIESVVQRIAKIIKGLRSYVREPSLEALEEVTVESLIEDSLTYCRDRFEKSNVQLVLQIEKKLTVKVLPYQISQVILNLMNNAIDALQNSDLKVVTVTAQKKDNGVEISVADTGPGIPYTLRSKIMEPFFTTKEVGKGVGLGLSICQGLIQGHHGKFYLDEESSHTTFKIWLGPV